MNKKNILITGAAGGIGSETARHLASIGKHLVLVDINIGPLQILAEELTIPSTCIHADLTSREKIQGIFEQVSTEIGELDILINTAGVIRNGPYEERSFQEIEHEMQLNFYAPAYLMRLFAEQMKARGTGHLISVSSLAAIVPLKECPMYTASKFALRGLMLSLYLALREYGVSVTNICPSAVDTPMLEAEVRSGGSKLNFIGHPMPPADIAAAIFKAINAGDKAEICVPVSDGLLSKLGGSFPGLIRRLAPVLEKMATKNHRSYLKSKGINI